MCLRGYNVSEALQDEGGNKTSPLLIQAWLERGTTVIAALVWYSQVHLWQCSFCFAYCMPATQGALTHPVYGLQHLGCLDTCAHWWATHSCMWTHLIGIKCFHLGGLRLVLLLNSTPCCSKAPDKFLRRHTTLAPNRACKAAGVFMQI